MSIPSTPSPLASILAAKTYNAAWFSGSTNEAKLSSAIAKAKADGALYVFTPSSFSGLNPALVTYDAAIQVYSEDDLAKAGIISAGAFSSTVLANAFTGATKEAKINAMLAFANTSGAKFGLISAALLPFDVTLLTNLVTFSAAGGRLIREGGNPSVYDARAYGAAGDGVANDGPAIQAAYDALPSIGGILSIPAGNYRFTATLSFGTKRFQLIGTGRSILSSTSACTRLVKASSLNGIGIRVWGINTTNGVKLDGFVLDGEGGNGGDGIALEANYGELSNFTITNQGRDGIRVGADVSVNSNLWSISNGAARANGRHGINLDDPAGGISANANACSIAHVDCSANTGDGCRIGNSYFNYFYNLTVQTNTGAGVRLTANAKQNTFFGGDIEEANAGGNIVVEAGATENSFIGTDATTGITDAGTGTFFQFRRGRINRLAFRNVGNTAFTAFTDGDTTPSIAAGSLFNCGNSAPTSITYFDDGVDGDVIVIKLDNQTNIVHNSGFIRMQNNLSIPTGSVDANAIIGFVRASNIWFEIFRSKSPIVENGSSDINQVFVTGGFRQSIDGWFQENVAAAQTNVVLTRLATTTEAPNAWIAPRSGSVTGVWVKMNTARTAGTLTISIFANGGLFGSITAVLDGTNTTFKATLQAKDVNAFSAGAELDLRVTTDAGWLPVTGDIRAGLEVET